MEFDEHREKLQADIDKALKKKEEEIMAIIEDFND